MAARFEVCSTCLGQGKVATSVNSNAKYASASEYLNNCQVLKCSECSGEGMLKVCAGTEEQIKAYAAKMDEKADKKKEKKKAKLEKKIS